MGSQLQWSWQVANQLSPRTSLLIPSHLLLPKTLQDTSRPSSSDFNSPTSRWPLLQPRPPPTHTTRAVWSMRSPPLLSEPPSWHPDGKDPLLEGPVCWKDPLPRLWRTRLLEGPSTKAWVDKLPGIMLTLNAVPHEPHGFSASMIATVANQLSLRTSLSDNIASPASEDAPGYVETIQQWLQLTHQQMATPPAASTSNPYHEGSLIYALTTPPERTSKLAPRWKGPFRVCRIPNEYEVTYEDDGMEWTIHINHANPAKFTAPDFPEPVPPVEVPRPPIGYLPAGLARRPPKPCAPPVNHNEASMPLPATPAVPIV